MEPSGAVLLARGSDIAYEAYGGAADVTTGLLCTPDTRFQIASISKQFAAAAMLLLVEDGVLAPTDSVTDWLEDCPAPWAEITLHHLLTHTSGLPHWEGTPGLGVDTPPSRAETVDRVMRLLPQPGPRDWHYSSPGYVLVALVIERASTLAYADFLTERIFLPLGLSSTTVGAKPPGQVARGHRNGEVRDIEDLSWMPGAGDVWATARDLAVWARALERGELLARASLSTMFAPHRTLRTRRPPCTVTGYGYGVFLGECAGQPAHFHDGDNIGYRSLLVRLPQSDTTMVALTNDERSDPHSAVGALAAGLARPRSMGHDRGGA